MKKFQSLMFVALMLVLSVGIAQAGESPLDFNGHLGHLLNDTWGQHLTAADQIDENGLFTMSINGTTSFMLENLTGNFSTFGIYEIGNTTNRLAIFDNTAAINARVNIAYDFTMPGAVLTGTITATGLAGYSYNSTATFTSLAGKTTSLFGYYVALTDGTTYYSDESLNTSGRDRMVLFETTDLPFHPGADYILAWDTSGSRFFDDFVVSAESMGPAAVPEPSTLVLLGGGLFGLGIAGYRKMRK